ncbi:MAG: LysM peptidoglycan-binding domain-containing protein [Cucumibacter sp.]
MIEVPGTETASSPSVETLPAPPQAPAIVPEPEAPRPEATAVAEVAVPTLVAVQAGDDGQRFVSGKVIIRRGDSLWTIARRVYGQGIRFSIIYEANTDQIRDPHWIYPGQVFDLPVANLTGISAGE